MPLLFSMYSFLLAQIVACLIVKIYKTTKFSCKQACKGMFGKSQTGAGQFSPSFPRCYTLLPEGQERGGLCIGANGAWRNICVQLGIGGQE